MYEQRNIDPMLEELRNDVTGPPNIQEIVLDLKKASKQVHASYLFETEGYTTLQKLCLLLSSTASGKNYGDWQTFAVHLGLTMEQIKCIDYDFKGLQDPTYYVLLSFAQSVDATFDKVLQTLYTIDRPDILNRIVDSVNKFIIDVSTCHHKDLKSGVLRPPTLLRVPLVLSPLLRSIDNNPGTSITSTSEAICNSNNQLYGGVVLLTFADDGATTASKIAQIFRSKQPKIGVVILQEQEKFICNRGEEFIDDCFKQVNYVIPVLTNDYIAKITGSPYFQEASNLSLDSKYLRYIYSLLRYDYIRQDCSNEKVRCIVADNQIDQMCKNNLNPILQVWFRESDIDLFAERIILRRF